MTLQIPFDNSYARLPDRLFTRVAPTKVTAPKLLAYNATLAANLGLTGLTDDITLAAHFSGNDIPKGAAPLAQLYAAHQFGNWNPKLGDGRAVLLGEINGPLGRFDLQLKGSGPTPYSRGGDGRAWLGPVLREYVISEAMHALGIPTTRALAAVATGETVVRETALPGAVLTRIASSHIRVGTFQALAARQDIEGLQALFEHARARHYPDAETPTDFLAAVCDRQAKLIAQWMSVGFIHGVMNTDNCAISGETIDYGPCAYLDTYHPLTVFSSIDRRGRYAYAAQPDIIVWNMAQLATALIPLMPDQDRAVEEFTKVVHAMPAQIESHRTDAFCAKIGITTPSGDDHRLVTDLLALMEHQGADFTNTFRALVHNTPENPARDQFLDPHSFDVWAGRWHGRLKTEQDPVTVMAHANPAIIPRNHQIEKMIQAAVAGDFAPFDRLMRALANPYADDSTVLDLTRPPTEDERVKQTFCGT